MSNPNIAQEGSKGGHARAKALSKKRKREIGLKGAWARWERPKTVDKVPISSVEPKHDEQD